MNITIVQTFPLLSLINLSKTQVSPLFTPETDVFFLLRLRNRSFDDAEVINFVDREDLRNSEFDPRNPVTFQIHGFMGGPKMELQNILSRSILVAEDVNLFFVDWSRGARTLNYYDARMRVNEVGKVLGKFTEFLEENFDVNLNDVKFIGFSLGAHVAGMAGKHLHGNLGKIVGIDPAGPLFNFEDPETRLDPNSAKQTECIHTGIPFGIKEPICHFDFYINKGSNQPNCGPIFLNLCSHARVNTIYSEALLNPKAFFGHECENLDQALNGTCIGANGAFINGKGMEKKKTGIFHVVTNEQSPYGRGLSD